MDASDYSLFKGSPLILVILKGIMKNPRLSLHSLLQLKKWDCTRGARYKYFPGSAPPYEWGQSGLENAVQKFLANLLKKVRQGKIEDKSVAVCLLLDH